MHRLGADRLCPMVDAFGCFRCRIPCFPTRLRQRMGIDELLVGCDESLFAHRSNLVRRGNLGIYQRLGYWQIGMNPHDPLQGLHVPKCLLPFVIAKRQRCYGGAIPEIER